MSHYFSRAAKALILLFVSLFCLLCNSTYASSVHTISVKRISNEQINQGIEESIGYIFLTQHAESLSISYDIRGLTTGIHGFHLHEAASCASKEKDGQYVAGLAAGGHYDPHKTNKHLGPHSTEGHKGDLLPIQCDINQRCVGQFETPHLTLKEAKKHAFIIHAMGDNFSDQPKALGGGGPRVACGLYVQ